MPDYNDNIYNQITLFPMTIVNVMKNHEKFNDLKEENKKLINDFGALISALISSQEPFSDAKRQELLDYEGKLAIAMALDPNGAVISDGIDTINAYFSLIRDARAEETLGKTVYDEESKTYKYIRETRSVSYDEYMKSSLEGYKDLSKMKEQSEFQSKNLQDMYINAENKAGYSKYELSSRIEAQTLKDICMEYRAMSGKDPKLEKILKKVETYASMDAHANKNYKKESDLLKEIMADLDKYADIVLEQQNNLTEEIANSAAEELDQQLTMKQELVENRLRIHGSLTSYFASLPVGNLQTPMERYLDPEKDKSEIAALNRVNSSIYGRYDGKGYSYINGVGVEIDLHHDLEGYGKGMTAAIKVGDALSKEYDVKDMPIFPHEPRMNDIQQRFLGDCYLLAGLQDVARLYPEKIKDMIKDNGDGTATVRLFEKQRNGYKPLYVKLDKKEALMGGVFAAGAENCLWATLIERAYMISGIHVTRDTMDIPTSVPDKGALDTIYDEYAKKKTLSEEDIKTLKKDFPWLIDKDNKLKKWQPSLGSIEAGHEYEFLETCFGAEFAPQKIYEPENAAERLKDWPQKYEDIYNNYDSKFKTFDNADKMQLFAGLSIGKSNASKMDFFESLYSSYEKQYGNDHDKFIRDCESAYERLSDAFNKVHPGKTPNIDFDAFNKNVSKDVGELSKMGPGFDMNYLDLFLKMKGRIDFGIQEVFSAKNSKSAIFDQIYDSLKQGLPVSAGTPENAPDVPETHAYSVIGAYKTKDNPPKMYVRIRNPWGGREGTDGIEFQKDQDGNPVAKKVGSKEGIFDMEFGSFLKNFNTVYVNKSEALKNTVHKKATEFEITEKDKTDLYSSNQVDQSMYMDHLKCAHDIYAALVDTNSVFSGDSDSYKLLLAEAKNYIDAVAMSKGQDITVIEAAVKKLEKKANDYLDHVENDAKGSPSSRQIKRMKVCETIKQLNEKEIYQPRKGFERDFAEKMVAQNCKNNKMDIKYNEIEDEAAKLVQNRAFRDIVNKMNINKMVNADEKILNNSLKEFQELTKKQGVEKVYDAEKQKSVEFQKSV